jgi:hypothetical protein
MSIFFCSFFLIFLFPYPIIRKKLRHIPVLHSRDRPDSIVLIFGYSAAPWMFPEDDSNMRSTVHQLFPVSLLAGFSVYSVVSSR